MAATTQGSSEPQPSSIWGYPGGAVVGHCASSAGQESEQPDLTLQLVLLEHWTANLPEILPNLSASRKLYTDNSQPAAG